MPRPRDVINTTSGLIELAPPLIAGDVARLQARLARPETGLVLIGRRDLRGTNSFMHNLPALVKGRESLHAARVARRRRGPAPGAGRGGA